MAYKLATTTLNDKIICVLLDEKERLVEVHPFDSQTQTEVGNIYTGKVMTVKKNINAAFVDIGAKDNVFVSINECRNIHYSKRHGSQKPIVQGDEILVQIQKDAHKQKLAKAITDFSLNGKYLILTTDTSSVFVSSKITDDKTRITLKKTLRPLATKSYGFIARTNSGTADKEIILEEAQQLIRQHDQLLNILPYRSSGQKLLTQPAPYMTILNDLYDHEIEALVYEDPTVCRQVTDYLMEQNHEVMADKVTLDDSGIPLASRLNLSAKIDKLLSKKVWLSSGASIIIEPTEALTVIDVNTERSISKKHPEETVFRTNMEAAKELMYQIRARNISGIIIVDFIDMTSAKDKNSLMEELRTLAAKDPQKTTVIGMTTLGLVEMTRKKKKAPLWELLS